MRTWLAWICLISVATVRAERAKVSKRVRINPLYPNLPDWDPQKIKPVTKKYVSNNDSWYEDSQSLLKNDSVAASQTDSVPSSTEGYEQQESETVLQGPEHDGTSLPDTKSIGLVEEPSEQTLESARVQPIFLPWFVHQNITKPTQNVSERLQLLMKYLDPNINTLYRPVVIVPYQDPSVNPVDPTKLPVLQPPPSETRHPQTEYGIPSSTLGITDLHERENSTTDTPSIFQKTLTRYSTPNTHNQNSGEEFHPQEDFPQNISHPQTENNSSTNNQSFPPGHVYEGEGDHQQPPLHSQQPVANINPPNDFSNETSHFLDQSRPEDDAQSSKTIPYHSQGDDVPIQQYISGSETSLNSVPSPPENDNQPSIAVKSPSTTETASPPSPSTLQAEKPQPGSDEVTATDSTSLETNNQEKDNSSLSPASHLSPEQTFAYQEVNQTARSIRSNIALKSLDHKSPSHTADLPIDLESQSISSKLTSSNRTTFNDSSIVPSSSPQGTIKPEEDFPSPPDDGHHTPIPLNSEADNGYPIFDDFQHLQPVIPSQEEYESPTLGAEIPQKPTPSGNGKPSATLSNLWPEGEKQSQSEISKRNNKPTITPTEPTLSPEKDHPPILSTDSSSATLHHQEPETEYGLPSTPSTKDPHQTQVVSSMANTPTEKNSSPPLLSEKSTETLTLHEHQPPIFQTNMNELNKTSVNITALNSTSPLTDEPVMNEDQATYRSSLQFEIPLSNADTPLWSENEPHISKIYNKTINESAVPLNSEAETNHEATSGYDNEEQQKSHFQTESNPS